MTDLDKVMKLVNENGGYITTKEVRNLHIHTNSLTKLVKEGKIERISRGYYVLPDIFGDEYFMVQFKSKNAIYSHATALYFHNLSDRIPIYLDLSVPVGYNGSLRSNRNVHLHYVKKENINLGLTNIKTSFGMNIKVYDMERTICDIIKNKNKMDIEIFTKALNGYSKSKEKNLNQLMRYAKILKVEKKVREYMEVLL